MTLSESFPFRDKQYLSSRRVWNGDPTQPNAFSRLRHRQMYIPKAIERLLKTAALGADLKSWKY
jgi:hypothetical protein